MVNWTRPKNVPFPCVWLTFQAKDNDSDEIVNYRVQDLPEDRFTEAVDHLMNYFNVDELLGAVKGIDRCPESLVEVRKDWEYCVLQKMSLACFKEGSDELVGINIILATHKNDKPQLPNGKVWKEVYSVLKYVSQSVNVFEKFQTDVYMSANGLWVSPNHRGKGVAQHILAARVPLGKAVGLTCTSTPFTSIAAQKAAARAGFEEVYSCSSEELESRGMHFPGIKPVKLMTLKIS